jgi:hypothetical protein
MRGLGVLAFLLVQEVSGFNPSPLFRQAVASRFVAFAVGGHHAEVLAR